MINGKPQLTFGGSETASPSKARAKKTASTGRTQGGDFASYLAPAAQQTVKAPVHTPYVQAEMPKAKMHLGFLPEGYISPNAQPSSFVRSSAPNQGKSQSPLSILTEARTQSRRQLSGINESSYIQKIAPVKKAPRISDRPITGRGNFGGMNTHTAGRSTLTARGATAHASPTANAAQGVGLGMAPQASMNMGNVPASIRGDNYSGYGLRNLRDHMPTSFVASGFSGRMAETALTSLGYNLQEVRNVQTSARLIDGNDVFSASVTRSRDPELAIRTAANRGVPIPKGRPGSLNNAFYDMANQGLGTLAAKFESGSEGIAAIGYDYKGGTSYGKYQISSKAGTMAKFIDYLQGEAPDLASRLHKAGPANTGGRGGRMPREWRQIASEDPQRFEQLQSDFIMSSHFKPALQGIAEMTGIAFGSMPMAFQEVLFSTAVQHGPSGAVRIFSQALNSVDTNRLRNTGGASSPSFLQAGKKLIEKVYSLRAGQFVSSTSRVRAAVKNRLTREMHEALQML